jgi:hypothetical protein
MGFGLDGFTEPGLELLLSNRCDHIALAVGPVAGLYYSGRH